MILILLSLTHEVLFVISNRLAWVFCSPREIFWLNRNYHALLLSFYKIVFSSFFLFSLTRGEANYLAFSSSFYPLIDIMNYFTSPNNNWSHISASRLCLLLERFSQIDKPVIGRAIKISLTYTSKDFLWIIHYWELLSLQDHMS